MGIAGGDESDWMDVVRALLQVRLGRVWGRWIGVRVGASSAYAD